MSKIISHRIVSSANFLGSEKTRLKKIIYLFTYLPTQLLSQLEQNVVLCTFEESVIVLVSDLSS